MATQPLVHYTLEEYLELEDTFEGRTEFHDGAVLTVELATPVHSRISSKVGFVLQSAYPAPCAVFDSSLNLFIPSANKVVHPDATVVCRTPSYPKPGCIDNPTILVEVTSPTTKDYDFGTKRELYFSLPSLQHYLLVSQTQALVSHYRRTDAGWFYTDYGRQETITLDEVTIPVESVFADILL